MERKMTPFSVLHIVQSLYLKCVLNGRLISELGKLTQQMIKQMGYVEIPGKKIY
jgi:hypothetical protein